MRADNVTKEDKPAVSPVPENTENEVKSNTDTSKLSSQETETVAGKKRAHEEGDDVNGEKDADIERKRLKADSEETKGESEETKSEIEETKGEEKQEDKKEEKNDDTTKPKNTEKANEKTGSKFVFGARTAFGQSAGFSMFGAKKNVFGETKEEVKDDKEEKETTPSRSVFGSGSKFGSGFQSALTKKSIFDEPQEEKKDETPEESDKPKSKEVYKKVHLEKQEIKSGEEEETTVFQVKAKLYHLDLTQVSDGWKEKGVGILKVNEFLNPPQHYKGRLVMRQDGILKLILNVPVVKGFELYKGMASSLNSDKFIRFQVIEDNKPAQYALKIGQVENSSKLYDSIKSLIPK